MADESTQAVTEQAESQEPQGTDWKAEARKWETRAKENKAAAEESQAKAAAALEAANSKIAALEADAAYASAVRDVAQATGYSETVIRGLKGTTVDELTANAEMLRANLSAYPLSRDAGEVAPVAKKSTADQFAAALEGIL